LQQFSADASLGGLVFPDRVQSDAIEHGKVLHRMGSGFATRIFSESRVQGPVQLASMQQCSNLVGSVPLVGSLHLSRANASPRRIPLFGHEELASDFRFGVQGPVHTTRAVAPGADFFEFKE
jgi:hypothetical protein